MTTWKTGRRLVAERLTARAVPLEDFVACVTVAHGRSRVPGTAVFMTAQPRGTPPALLHNLKHNKVLHERVIILTRADARRCRTCRRTSGCRSRPLGHDFYDVVLRYGFMEEPNVPEALALRARRRG